MTKRGNKKYSQLIIIKYCSLIIAAESKFMASLRVKCLDLEQLVQYQCFSLPKKVNFSTNADLYLTHIDLTVLVDLKAHQIFLPCY